MTVRSTSNFFFVSLALRRLSEAKPPTKLCDNQARVKLVADGCHARQWPQPRYDPEYPPFWQLYVDDYHRILYCKLPKAGSTSFLTMMANQTKRMPRDTKINVHSYDVMRQFNLRALTIFPEEEIQRRLQSYTKIILVRHPFDRLLSVYNDKFVHKKYSQAFEHRDFILKTLGDGVLENGEISLSFKQFLQLVAAGYGREFENFHWESQFDNCYPCNTTYDYILKLETLESDFGRVSNLFLNPGQKTVTLPYLNEKRSEEKLSVVSDIFQQLDEDLVRDLMNVYKADFQLFGYHWDKDLGATCQTDVEGENCC